MTNLTKNVCQQETHNETSPVSQACIPDFLKLGKDTFTLLHAGIDHLGTLLQCVLRLRVVGLGSSRT